MIHYHGTPISGSDPEKFLMGRHALVPHMYQGNLEMVMECCQSFVLDNSAFSYWKSGGQLNVDDYYKWVKSLEGHPGLDWCLIPDVIDGTEEQNKELIHQWIHKSLRVKSVPVWHLHESFDYLRWLILKFDTVAFGSSGQWATPGTQGWWARMEQVMEVACHKDGRPRARFHGLRMLDPEIFTKLPFSSADSTNAGVNAGSIKRFGSYIPPTAGRRATVIADRIESHNSAAIWVAPKQEDMFYV